MPCEKGDAGAADAYKTPWLQLESEMVGAHCAVGGRERAVAPQGRIFSSPGSSLAESDIFGSFSQLRMRKQL